MSDKIIDHAVIQEASEFDFEQKVRKMLRDGWKLYGNLCFSVSANGTTYFAREFVKYDKYTS